MIKVEEVKKLAQLARIELSEVEAEKLQGEMEKILDYVSELGEVDTEGTKDSPLPVASGSSLRRDLGALINVMREDIVTNETGEYKEAILANAPKREGDYFAVKAIFEDR